MKHQRLLSADTIEEIAMHILAIPVLIILGILACILLTIDWYRVDEVQD